MQNVSVQDISHVEMQLRFPTEISCDTVTLEIGMCQNSTRAKHHSNSTKEPHELLGKDIFFNWNVFQIEFWNVCKYDNNDTKSDCTQNLNMYSKDPKKLTHSQDGLGCISAKTKQKICFDVA